ncbi:MAG: division/cell wall cluster transcriptional repressor MraZ [Chloroflexota bacterium]
MFLGKYSIGLDEKNRFVTPAKFLNSLSSGFYMAQGFDRNLWVLTPDAFKSIYRKISSLNLADPLARMLLRTILSTAHELQPNEDGAILIPEELKKFAKIKRTILLIGQGDYFEIWEPALWAEQETQLRDAEANSGRFSSLSIVTR